MTAFLCCTTFIAFCLLTGRKRGVIFALFPLANIGYFIVSTSIFDFGQFLPFGIYEERKWNLYNFICWAIFLHFLVAYLGLTAGDHLTISQRSRPILRDTLLGRPKRELGLLAFVVCISPAVFVLLSFDIGWLIDRDSFSFPGAVYGWMRFADITFWLSALLTPFLARRQHRVLALTLVVVVFATLGSRSAPVMLLIYVGIERLVLGEKRKAHYVLVAFALSLLAVLLSMRPLNQGGLVALLQRVATLELAEFWTFVGFGLNYVLNFSVAINAEMIAHGNVEPRFFYYSVLPLPSFLYDLTVEFDAQNRFRANIPYPGFGFALSFLGLWLYLLTVGLAYMTIGLLRNVLVTRRDAVEQLMLYAVVFLPFVVGLQYNLRTASRIFYFFIGLYFIVGVLRRMQIGSLRQGRQ